MRKREIINKTMDLEDLNSPDALEIVNELNELILNLKKKNLKISSWYGRFDLDGNPNSIEYINRGYGYKPLKGATDDKNFPWFLYWEIVWVILNNKFIPGQNVLDLGGSSSLFSFYLASKGLNVVTVDLQKRLVDNANFVASKMGWNLKNYQMDIRKLDLNMKFDHITSICVYEHIPLYDRIEINKRIKDLLKEKGTFSLTFDYKNPSKFARINSPEDVYDQFVKPSGLHVRGNETFFDNGKRYLLHPFFITIESSGLSYGYIRYIKLQEDILICESSLKPKTKMTIHLVHCFWKKDKSSKPKSLLQNFKNILEIFYSL